jgi:AcrR family transcriptional regulator
LAVPKAAGRPAVKDKSETNDAGLSRISRRNKQKREGILSSAATVFAEMGYYRANLEDIAERLDLTRAALYHYFPSKDILLSACLEYGAQEALSQLTAASEKTADDGPDLQLEELIRTQLIVITRDEPELSRLFLSTIDWPDDFRVRVKSLRDQHDKFFRDAINDGIRTGEFKCFDPDIARHCLHGAVNYAAVWLNPKKQSYERSIEAVVRSLMLLFHAPSDR